MSTLTEILLALASVMAVGTLSVVVALRVLYRRLRRSRAIGGSVLRARALVSVGRQHEVLALRVRLTDTLASGQAALDLARQNGSRLGELHRLYDRIRIDGAALDAQLLLLRSERDALVLKEAIPVAERRVGQIVSLIGRLRAAVAASLGELTDDSLAQLTRELEREITALDAGLRELHTLHWRDAHTSLNPLPGRTES